MTGWRRLITATVRLAHRDGTRLRRRAAAGRLLFEPVGEATGRSAERVRGIVTGAWALSAEICQGSRAKSRLEENRKALRSRASAARRPPSTETGTNGAPWRPYGRRRRNASRSP